MQLVVDNDNNTMIANIPFFMSLDFALPPSSKKACYKMEEAWNWYATP